MAFKFPYMVQNFVGSFANDVAASAWVVANGWDGGLATPQEDQWYYDTTLHTFRIWSGAAWVSLPLVDGSIQFTGILAYDAPGKPFANPAEIVDKQYVDAAISGLSLKDCVRVSTTGHVVLVNQFEGAVIDGVALVAGDRFLVRAQNPIDADENGVYIAQTAPVAPVRAADCAAGVGASGAWVIATEGAGTNADKGWLCTTDGAVFGDVISFVVFPSFSGHYFGEEGVFVDWTYGVDAVTADGSPDNPYKTLAYACTRVVAPVNVAEFCTPVVFHVGPGVYTGPVTLPQRLAMKICGDDYTLSGNINWPIDPQWWNTFGLNAGMILPSVQIVRNNARDGMGPRMPVVGYPQGVQLVSGTFAAYNSVEGTGFTMPEHVLVLDGVNRNAYTIYNQPATTAVLTDAPGAMQLYLYHSQTTGTCIIAGEVNRDGANLVPNDVKVYAYYSMLTMYGTCTITDIENCTYEADYRKDHVGGAYAYGRIQGANQSLMGTVNVRTSQQTLKNGSYMGWDATAPAPGHDPSVAISFDRDSLISIGETTTTDWALQFNGFHAMPNQDGAYGRGWYYGFEEVRPTGGRLRIPCSGRDGAYRLFEHTYSIADHWTPNSVALSQHNRLTIELESGQYRLMAPFTADKEFVDIIGIGSSGVLAGNGDVYDPSVVFFLDANRFSWSVTEASMQNILLLQHADVATENECLYVTVEAALSSFKNLAFAQDATTVGTVRAVTIDAALAPTKVRASWEDCRTKLTGFLFGGGISPTICARCTAGNYSFGGWTGVAPLSFDVEGTFVDCEAGTYSFAATDVGGDVRFMGTATRCRTAGMGFGHTSGGVGPYTAECGGASTAILTDCDNYSVGNGHSFGCSGTGTGTASARFIRCTSGYRSFGHSAAAAAKGIFSGVADKCEAGYQSFGANTATFDMAEFTGIAIDCIATYQSFGARGVFTGQAYRCHATYGSFGWQTVPATSALMDGCKITSVRETLLTDGPPGIYGGCMRRCYVETKAGRDAPCLVLMGGTAVGGDESRVYDCDLIVKDTHATTIDCLGGGGPFDIQLAQSRMRVPVAASVINVLAVPYNVVDAAYDPS